MTKLGTVIARGATGARPAAATPGALFFDTTLGKLQRDTGSTWEDVEHVPLGAIVKRAAAQTVSDGATVAISWDTETKDENGFYAAGNPTRITIPKTGWYVMTAYVDWANDPDGVRHAQFKINNTTWGFAQSTSVMSNQDGRLNPAQVAYLTAADYVELFVYHNAGGNLDVSYAEMTIVQLTP